MNEDVIVLNDGKVMMCESWDRTAIIERMVSASGTAHYLVQVATECINPDDDKKERRYVQMLVSPVAITAMVNVLGEMFSSQGYVDDVMDQIDQETDEAIKRSSAIGPEALETLRASIAEMKAVTRAVFEEAIRSRDI